MYGAFIGDIIGSKYEFQNIKTKEFPLFSRGCDYTDDTIMTVAVAKAILLSRDEQFEKNENGKDGFIMHERTEGTYSRSFKFEDVDPEGINAAFANGELDISLKKAAKSQGKQISIN